MFSSVRHAFISFSRRSRVGNCQLEVILSGGEASTSDRTAVNGFDGVDGNAPIHAAGAIFSTVSTLHDVVRSPEGLRPPQDDITLTSFED